MSKLEQGKTHENFVKDGYSQKNSAEVSIQDLPPGRVIGELQRKGVVVVKNTAHGSALVATIRHPSLIPEGNKFGGRQRIRMIEHAKIKPVGQEQAAETAKYYLKSEKLPTIGAELEGYAYNIQTGEVVPAGEQIECAKGLREDPMKDPANSPKELAVARANLILERDALERRRGNIVVETSVPFSTGGKNVRNVPGLTLSEEEYIQAMGKLFKTSYFVPSGLLDPRVRKVLNEYADSQGFDDIDKMLDELGVASVWNIAASHVSLGIPRQTEAAIAVGNMFSSDLATAGEFFTQSTPVYAGKMFDFADKGQAPIFLRDVRTLGKYHLRTAYVTDPLINSVEEYQNRIIEGVVEGMATTPDRSAFFNTAPDGKRFVAAHARARIRGFGDPNVVSERVEFVGGSSTPSVYDVLARDAYLTVLWTAAVEAVSHQRSPQEYFKQKGFSLAGTAEYQQELAIRHALYGATDEGVSYTIQQNLEFMNYMHDTYPHLRDYIKFVNARLNNLKRKPIVRDIHEYTNNPQGSIAGVIIRMKQRGDSDIKILHQLNDHQLIVSEKVLKCKGDYSELLNQVQ